MAPNGSQASNQGMCSDGEWNPHLLVHRMMPTQLSRSGRAHVPIFWETRLLGSQEKPLWYLIPSPQCVSVMKGEDLQIAVNSRCGGREGKTFSQSLHTRGCALTGHVSQKFTQGRCELPGKVGGLKPMKHSWCRPLLFSCTAHGGCSFSKELSASQPGGSDPKVFPFPAAVSPMPPAQLSGCQAQLHTNVDTAEDPHPTGEGSHGTMTSGLLPHGCCTITW